MTRWKDDIARIVAMAGLASAAGTVATYAYLIGFYEQWGLQPEQVGFTRADLLLRPATGIFFTFGAFAILPISLRLRPSGINPRQLRVILCGSVLLLFLTVSTNTLWPQLSTLWIAWPILVAILFAFAALLYSGVSLIQLQKESHSAEFMDEAVKRVIETSCPIAEIARDIHVNEETLRNWVYKYRAVHADDEPALSVSERARLRELGTDNPWTGWTVRWSPFFRWAGPVVVFAVVAVAPLGLYRAGVHDGARIQMGDPARRDLYVSSWHALSGAQVEPVLIRWTGSPSSPLSDKYADYAQLLAERNGVVVVFDVNRCLTLRFSASAVEVQGLPDLHPEGGSTATPPRPPSRCVRT